MCLLNPLADLFVFLWNKTYINNDFMAEMRLLVHLFSLTVDL